MSHKEHHRSSHPSITALKDSIVFQFTDVDVRNGKFYETSSASGIYLGTNHDANAKSVRNGKVVAIGPLVEAVQVGDIIMIEPLMWTEGFKIDGEMYWKTAEEKVMAIVE